MHGSPLMYIGHIVKFTNSELSFPYFYLSFLSSFHFIFLFFYFQNLGLGLGTTSLSHTSVTSDDMVTMTVTSHITQRKT